MPEEHETKNEPDYGDRKPRPNEPRQPADAPTQPPEEAPFPDKGNPTPIDAPKSLPGGNVNR